MSRTAHALAEWQGYLSHNEVDEIKRVVKSTQGFENIDVVCVNIGAGAGTSTLSMIEEREDLIVFSVDILATGSEITTNEHLRLAETGHDKDGRVIKVWGDSKVAGKRWPYPVDILFVDGDHEFDGIMGDIEAWYDKVVPGGWILFHDYGSNNWPAVKKVVDWMMKDDVAVSVVDTLAVFRKKE